MAVSVAEAFERRHVIREDGVHVLPQNMLSMTAMEAGYCPASPTIEEAAKGTTYPGQMTADEFARFCDANKASMMTADDLAKSMVIIAPSGVITRASLEELMKKSDAKEGMLTEDEVEALFTTVDPDNKGAITADSFMRCIYGEEGVNRLAAWRKKEIAEKAARDKMEKEQAAAAAKAAAAKSKAAEAEKKPEKASGCC